MKKKPPLVKPARRNEPGREMTMAARVDRLLAAVRAEPDRVFNPTEMARLGGFPDPSHSGGLHGQLNRLVAEKVFTKLGKGQYQLAKNGKA